MSGARLSDDLVQSWLDEAFTAMRSERVSRNQLAVEWSSGYWHGVLDVATRILGLERATLLAQTFDRWQDRKSTVGSG